MHPPQHKPQRACSLPRGTGEPPFQRLRRWLLPFPSSGSLSPVVTLSKCPVSSAVGQSKGMHQKKLNSPSSTLPTTEYLLLSPPRGSIPSRCRNGPERQGECKGPEVRQGLAGWSPRAGDRGWRAGGGMCGVGLGASTRSCRPPVCSRGHGERRPTWSYYMSVRSPGHPGEGAGERREGQ